MFASPDQTSWGHKSTLIPTTWNPADKAAECTLSNGNLTASFSAGDKAVRAAYGYDIESDVGLYFEFTADNAAAWNHGWIGIGLASAPLIGTNPYNNAASWLIEFKYGIKLNADSASYGSEIPEDQPGMCAIRDGKLYWGTAGTWFASGNPDTGANPAFSGLTGIVYPILYGATGDIYSANFGQLPFTNTPPASCLPGWGAFE